MTTDEYNDLDIGLNLELDSAESYFQCMTVQALSLQVPDTGKVEQQTSSRSYVEPTFLMAPLMMQPASLYRVALVGVLPAVTVARYVHRFSLVGKQLMFTPMIIKRLATLRR